MGETEQANSKDEQFIFFDFKKELLNKYDLPDKRYPIRMSKFEETLQDDSLTITTLANECVLYFEQEGTDEDDFEILIRLCHTAGIIVGRAGDDNKAREYFEIAHKYDPLNYPLVSDYVLSLCNTGDDFKAVSILENFISYSLDNWEYLIPHAWTEAIKIYFRMKNYDRALELVTLLLNREPDDLKNFSRKDLEIIANHIKEKKDNQL